MEIPISDNNNNNNVNNIITILLIDYDTDNRIINRNRMPIRCRTIVPCSLISLNAVNIKSDY